MSSGDDDITVFSPVKPETKLQDPADIIKEVIPDFTENVYHDPMKSIPVLAKPKLGLTVNQLFTLMIGTLPADRICHRKPTSVMYNGVFVVDLSSVRCIDDLRADDNGVWTHAGKPRRKYHIRHDHEAPGVIYADPVEDSTPESEIFTLVRLYHHHKSTPEFQRRISYVLDHEGQKVQYAVVQYLFEGGNEVPVVIPPHGNSKKEKSSYRRTQKSTLSKVKKMSGTPKSLVSALYNEAGGSLGASSASELPRNRRQIYNSKYAMSSSTKPDKSDPLFELVQQCKADLLPGGRRFIRSVNFDTSPSCVLATDDQLQNIVRFCTNPGASCVLGIDPTFNLGKFYVTVTTFTYTHVVNKSTSKSPTFFGPMFVHTEKNYDAYYSFFSTLLKLEPTVRNVIAVGTDGEQALVKAIRSVFSEQTIHLRCFIHMKDNIRRKLTNMLLPESIREDMVRDIFGTQQGTVHVKGILDASDEGDFDHRLLALKEKWDSLEYSVHPHQEPQFYRWLLKNEANHMKLSMIGSVRESAGLGSPPAPYTTNRNESMNNVAKAHADYRQSDWVTLVNNMYDLVQNQSMEVEKAVYGMGEYVFKPAYKSLEIDSSKWFMMSCEQRQRHLKKVVTLQCTQFESSTPSSSGGHSHRSMSIQPEKSGIGTISSELLRRTWIKAEKLLNSSGSICPAPGMEDGVCVASETGSKPHIVSISKKGSLVCDEACLAWKSQRLCSHVLAVAEEKGCLNEFLISHRRAKIQGNYTAVCMHNQSKNVGKKPGYPKRKAKPGEKPDIDTYVDPLADVLASETASGTVVPEPHCFSSKSSSLSTSSGEYFAVSSQSSPLMSTNQVCQLNLHPQSITSSFQCSPLTVAPRVSRRSTQPTVVVSHPFEVKILTPAIKVCAGCRNGYTRGTDGTAPPPMDLCLVHKEQHLYYNVVNAKQQLSSLSNVHYHANTSCPKMRFPDFNPCTVHVPPEVKQKLQSLHRAFLQHTFGIEL